MTTDDDTPQDERGSRPTTHIVRGRHGGALTPFTPATSKAANDKRWAAHRRGAMRAIYEVTGAANVEQAGYELAKPLVETLKKGGRGIAPLHRELIRSADLVPDRRDAPRLPDGLAAVVGLTQEGLNGLAAAIVEHLKQDK